MSNAKPKKKLSRPGNRNRKPTAWQRSATFANMGSDALRKFRAERWLHPKCGATAKSTGEPCRQLALENGRCHWHGGATPKGDEWGHRQLRAKPRSKQAPSDWRKAEAKLKKRAAQDRDRIRRLRAMTDEQFDRYVARMGRRLDDRFAPEFRSALSEEISRRGRGRSVGLLAETPRAVSPEVRQIEDRITKLKEELDVLNLRQGVFA